jgi:hypothetical protein
VAKKKTLLAQILFRSHHYADLGHGSIVVFLSFLLKTLLVRLEGLHPFSHGGSPLASRSSAVSSFAAGVCDEDGSSGLAGRWTALTGLDSAVETPSTNNSVSSIREADCCS